MEEVELKISKPGQGAFAISLVEKPAIEENFIFLSKEDIQLSISNEERREVIGLALVPDKRIPRRVNGKEFNVWFSAQTVRETAYSYMESLNLRNATTSHETKVEDLCVVESWIVEDVENDKLNFYKIKPVLNGWAVKMVVNNPDVIEGIKMGKYKGFSIEAKYSGMEEILKQYKDVDCDELLVENILKSIS